MRHRMHLGLDDHVRHCVLTGMDWRGKLLSANGCRHRRQH